MVLLLLAACHDAPRKNPFDPVLTPAVEEVRAAVDREEGTVLLAWSPYEGKQPFAEYRVLRQVKDRVAVDTLAGIVEPTQTTFKDTTLEPDLIYLYRVAVVNQAGFAVESPEVSVSSFSVSGVDLLEALPDPAQGRISLRWERYSGPGFEGYEIWRRRFGQENQRLEVVEEVGDTRWIDTSPRPGIAYLYWITLRAAGQSPESQRREASYELPPVALLRADLSSETAAAELAWTAYRGPRFAAYEVRRESAARLEQTVKVLEEVTDTTYTDPFLDGNTEYTYHIFVRTGWGTDVGVASEKRRDLFYALGEIRPMPSLSNEEVQAVGLAVDAQDRLYAAVTLISTTTARVMQKGVRIQFPGTLRYRTYFSHIEPSRLSPVHLAAGGDQVFVAVGGGEEGVLVGAIQVDSEGSSPAWSVATDTGGARPVGLYREADGDVVLVDEEGILYGFRPDGESAAPSDKLQVTLEPGLLLKHVVVGRGAGPGGDDQFFLLSPERDQHHVIGRTLTPLGESFIFGGRSKFDDGVGPGNGQTLNPLVLAYDPSRTRLVVLEAQGRLQVLDAAPEDVAPRYITQWGRFGVGEGEFQVSPPTSVAVVVDSQGRIYVADGEERIQLFVP